MKDNSHKVIFIVGIGRSGTTLLQSMLNAHSKIHFNKESHFIKNYVVREIADRKKNSFSVNDFISSIKKDQHFSDFFDKIESVKSKISVTPTELYTPVFFELLLRKEDVHYLGEKDPLNVNYLREIKSAFPNSKVIHIIRDPRDVILSRIKSGWAKYKSVIWHSVEYNFSLNKSRREGVLLFDQNYIELKYEDLTTDSSGQLENLCLFLGIEFETSMLSPEKNAEKLIRADEMAWKSNVLNPIITNNAGKWKTGLTQNQKKVTNTILKPSIEQLSYEVIKINFLDPIVLFYYTLAKALNVLFKIRYK